MRQHENGSHFMKDTLECCHQNLLPPTSLYWKSQGYEFQGSHGSGYENGIRFVM